jgi:hypothetical protein
MLELKDSTDAQVIVNMKSFINMGFDSVGRPNLLAILARWLPKTCQPIDTMKNGVLLLDYICSNMPAHCDSINAVLDARNCNTNQMHVESAKGMVKLASIYTERIHKIYVVDASWLVKGFFKVLYPFMPAKTKGKIIFVN